MTAALVILGAALVDAPLAAAPTGPRILVFTKTAGFHHESIPAAVVAVRTLAEANGLRVDATESSSAFADANLSRYRAVVFLLTTGDVLDTGEQGAFERFVRRGGGYVGVHSAADTEYGWAWYGGLVGAYFRSHPHIQRGVVRVQDRRHPATVGLPQSWSRTDEWYNFRQSPRPRVRVLATLDETTYSPGEGAMGADHPIAWSHAYQGGRAWYTAGGHAEEAYSEPLFRRHLLGGIRYAAGLTPPRIVSVRPVVRARRVVVTVRYASCTPCTGQLRVRLRGRVTRTRLSLGGTTGRATSPVLPRGRWLTSVVLQDPATGLAQTVTRWVRVR